MGLIWKSESKSGETVAFIYKSLSHPVIGDRECEFELHFEIPSISLNVSLFGNIF